MMVAFINDGINRTMEMELVEVSNKGTEFQFIFKNDNWRHTFTVDTEIKFDCSADNAEHVFCYLMSHLWGEVRSRFSRGEFVTLNRLANLMGVVEKRFKDGYFE